MANKDNGLKIINSKDEQLVAGFKTAYIDGALASDVAYRPEFVSNNAKDGNKVIKSIEDELSKCDKFQISVAFITMGGIEPLLLKLKELEKKNIPGEILTTNYLNFTQPAALKKLHDLKNIKIRMFNVEAAGKDFHTKGYIFKKEEIYRIIIGSSNMTGNALTKNYEWNTKLISTKNGEIVEDILKEYNSLWNSEFTMDYDEFYEIYRERYNIIKRQREIAKSEEIPSFEKFNLKPNSMQEEFIVGLRNIMESGGSRALLISATGTGKTYASAFAMRELGFKRVLFLVHRNQLARQTKKSYKKVFEKSVSMGVICGRDSIDENIDKDIIFATIQTLAKEDNLKRFKPDDFSAIILDESHHSPANSYQKIINYFNPKLLLGMTATPDKRDDNIEERNVYKQFDYNIAHEIRLQQAMEEDLLCPFHYFGISDLTIIGDLENEISKNSGTSEISNGEKAMSVPDGDVSVTVDVEDVKELMFKHLTSDERVKHIIEQASYYGYSGDRVKGIIFCSSIKESEVLSEKLNNEINPDTGMHYRTMPLNGSATESEREEAFERLAVDEDDNPDNLSPLDYILSVEILNEGVDIIEINQVIMLRPTMSPIVFVQQLGRGLRKADGKEFVVILDFIGNYKNNFMIPIALSGDRTYNKDNVRKFVIDGGVIVPGCSSIHFDEVSRKKIFESIDNANFSDIKLIKDNYQNLKFKLGRIPKLMDFDKYGEMDVIRIFDNKSLGSYYKFLVKYEKEYKIRLNATEEKMVEFVSKKIASGKRIHEIEFLELLLNNETSLIQKFKEEMKEKYDKECSDITINCVVNYMTNAFPTGGNKKTYDMCIFIEKDSRGDYSVTKNYLKCIHNKEFRDIIEELIEFGKYRYERDYSEPYKDTDLVLYKKLYFNTTFLCM